MHYMPFESCNIYFDSTALELNTVTAIK